MFSKLKTYFSSKRRPAIRLWAVLVWLLVWQVGAQILNEHLLLPTPVDVIKRLISLVGTADYWQRVLFTLWHIVFGLILGMAAGVLLGCVSALSKIVKQLLAPLMYVIKTIPVASFIILALVWLDEETLGEFISFLICLPVFYVNTLSGIESADGKLIEMTKMYRVGFVKRVRAVYLPAIAPYFGAALDVAVGLSFKSGTAAEVIAIPGGSIGEKLYRAKIYFETGDMLAWTITIVLMSALTAFLLKHAVRALTGRFHHE